MRVLLAAIFLFCFMVCYSQNDSGIAYVKIKKGILTFRKTQPPEDVKVYISTKLQSEKDGHYEIRYKPNSSSIYELTKKKVDGPGESAFKAIGGLLVLVLTALSVVSHF